MTAKAGFEYMVAVGAVGGSLEHLLPLMDSLVPPDAKNLRWAKMDVAVSASAIRPLAEMAKRTGAWITPNLQCQEGHLLYVRKALRTVQALRQVVKALQDAGVGLLLGADDNGDVHDELASLVAAGLTPYQALLTGTRNVAHYFRMLDSAGTVAVGKRADLLLVNGDPLQDIRHVREPAGVMLAGRWLDRAELDRGVLASSHAWLTMLGDRVSLVGGTSPFAKPRPKTRFYTRLIGLADSLAGAPPQSPAYERALRQLIAELGTIRPGLTPAQQVLFDRMARVWLREQARHGYRLTVPGLSVIP